MDPLHSLIRDSLKKKPIGHSINFEWFITEVGIVALNKCKVENISSLDPIKEAIELDLDLSREEKQFVSLDQKEIILFYS